MVNFTFTEEQEMFHKASKEFAETKVAPPCGGNGRNRSNPGSDQSPGRGRNAGRTIPEEYGLGLGHVARLIALEKSAGSPAKAMMLQVFHPGH